MLQASELKDEINAVVEAIDNMFRIEGDMEEDDVEHLHGRFVACIDAVNSRLQKCDTLLRRGLMTEAIQEAEIAPPVLGLVDDLDALESWDSWSDYVRQFGIPPQPQLLLEIAAELNIAYSKAQPIDKLLRQHRLFAIARVALKDRIPTLRELAARDPENIVWKTDLVEYETQRLRQIDGDFRSAFKLGELKRVTELLGELESTPWSVQPSKQLESSLRNAHHQLLVADAQRKLEVIAKELNAAFSDFDTNHGRLTRNQWDHYNQIAQLEADSPLMREVDAAMQWLNDEDQSEEHQAAHQRAVMELERALDDPNTKRIELERLYAVAERFDEPIPDRLTRRFDERVRSLTLAERRRGLLVLVTSLVAVLTCAAAVALFAFYQMRSNEVSQFEAALAVLVTGAKLEEAETMLAEVPTEKTYVMQSAGVRKLAAEVGKMRTDDDARRQRLSQYLQNVVEIYSNRPTLESTRRAADQLREAEKSVRLESEQTELKRVETELKSAENRLQREVDDKFSQEVAALTKELDGLSNYSRRQVEDLLARARLMARPSQVTASIFSSSGIELAVQKLQEHLDNMEFANQVADAEQRLIENIDKLELYRLALENYRSISKNSGRSTDFEVVLEELEVFKSFLMAWDTFSSRWNALDVSDDTEQNAKNGLQLIKEREASFSDLPFAPNASMLEPHFKAIADRAKPGAEPLKKFLDYLGEKLFKLKYVDLNRGGRGPVRHYIDSAPGVYKGGGKSIYPLESPQKLFPKNPTPIIISNTEEEQGATANEAPHSVLAKNLAKILKNPGRSYEAKVCEALHTIAIDSSTDPIIRGLMMNKLADLAVPGSFALSTELKNLKKALQGMQNYSNTNWFENTDEVNSDRKLAKQDIAKIAIQPRAIYVQKIGPLLKQLNASKRPLGKIRWVGILLKQDTDTGSEWTCPLVQTPEPIVNGSTYMRYLKGRDMITTRIGEISGGQVKLDLSKVAEFKEGRPIWIYQTPTAQALP